MELLNTHIAAEYIFDLGTNKIIGCSNASSCNVAIIPAEVEDPSYGNIMVEIIRIAEGALSNLNASYIELSSNIVRIDNFKEFLEELETNKDIIDFINNLALDNTEKQDANNKVEFMTIHQSKGLEFPIVIIPGLEEGILPSSKAKTPLQIEEERRICYVGITRTKDNCVLITNKKRFLYGKEQNQKESRFLLEILGEQQ